MWSRRTVGALVLAGAAAATSGCLLNDVNETWYLSSDGAVTWSVLEVDVRSDAKAAADREREEQEYLAAVRGLAHPIASGLRLFGASDVHAAVLRATAPYSVLTEARFTDIGELGRRLIVQTGLAGTSVLARTAGGRRWTFAVHDPRAENPNADDDPGVSALMAGFSGLRVVLDRGRFTTADGFDLSGDGRVAALTAFDRSGDEGGADTVTLVLEWTTGGAGRAW